MVLPSRLNLTIIASEETFYDFNEETDETIFSCFKKWRFFFPARFSKLYILAKWRQIFNALANQFVFLQTA